MDAKRILILTGSLLLSACPVEEGNDQSTQGDLPTDDEVLSKIYDRHYSVPAGFLVDERADTLGSYTIYHVKDPSVSYELCTDDYAEALEWEAAANEQQAVQGPFVGSIENRRYFEVIRDLSYPDSIGNVPGDTSPGYSRVFKCSYANRDGVDRNLRTGFAGILNVSPLADTDVREYVEYLWQFTFFWPSEKKVLASVSNETPGEFEHTLVLGLRTLQGWDRCDLIEVIDWKFSVAKSSHEVTKNYHVRRRFEAKFVGGVPEKC